MRLGKKLLLLLFLGCLAAASLPAVETTFWQVGSFDDLLQGTLRGVSLTKEGELELAPETQEVFNPDETLALSLASGRDHDLYIGTGHQGKVFRIGPDRKGSLFFTAQEPDIFALAVGPDGALYVGSSPEGKIYRVAPDGKSRVFFDPKTKYIWALTFDSKGELYAGTGDRGLIFKIDRDGKGNVFFDSKQTHIMCLTHDAAGNLLAGSDPNGLIYRISPEGKAFVLYQADLPEIHDLAVDSQGRIYAAALGGAGGRGFPLPGVVPGAHTVVAPQVTTVTVTAAGGESPEAAKGQQTPKNAKSGPSFNRPTASPLAFGLPAAPKGQGALIRILPDYSTETIWTSKKESIFGLALHGKQVLFTTDEDGRIFEVNPSEDGQNLTLLAETHEALATRLLYQGRELYVATGNIARLIRLGSSMGREGTYESPVKDTKFISRWGTLAWRGTVPEGASLKFYARSGNSGRPDQTWSDWAGPYTNSDGSALKCPPARYIQWKAVLQGAAKGSPVLDDVTVSYLNQNLPPQIQSLNVSTGGERTGPTGMSSSSAQAAASMGATVTVTPGPPSVIPSTMPSGTPNQPSPTILSWQADDPNGDTLTYTLYVKASDESAWHLLKDKLHQTSYVVEPNALPDGKYVARLVASDEESNPPSTARRAELVSAPFWIDNTPPQVQVLRQTPLPGGAEIHFQATDDTSPLASADVSEDGKEWHDIYPDDGMADSQTETFTVRVRNLAPGEHVIMLRAYDTAGNAGLGKALVRIPGGSTSQP